VASVSLEGVSVTSGTSSEASDDHEPAATTTLGTVSRGATTTYEVEKDGHVIEMLPQKNGGALQRGNPGNRGGGGVTRQLREAFRGDLEVARQRIVGILADADADPKDLIAIFDKLAKYSVGEKREGVVVDAELLNELFEPVERCVQDSGDLMVIREQWLDVLGQRLRA